jgi:hypothetical protein
MAGRKVVRKIVTATGPALALCIAVLVFLVSCTTFTVVGLEQGVSPTGRPYKELGNFTEREWVNKFLGASGGTNLFNISSHATDGVVTRAITKNLRKFGGNAVINLEISYVSNPFQGILNTLTLHIWAPSTVVVKGTVIKQE